MMLTFGNGASDVWRGKGKMSSQIDLKKEGVKQDVDGVWKKQVSVEMKGVSEIFQEDRKGGLRAFKGCFFLTRGQKQIVGI